jgi:hypothetical protein
MDMESHTAYLASVTESYDSALMRMTQQLFTAVYNITMMTATLIMLQPRRAAYVFGQGTYHAANTIQQLSQ